MSVYLVDGGVLIASVERAATACGDSEVTLKKSGEAALDII